MADVSKLKIPDDWVEKNDVPKAILAKHDDYLKAWFIAKTCDVVVIPATAFYADKGAERWARTTSGSASARTTRSNKPPRASATSSPSSSPSSPPPPQVGTA